MPGFDLQGARKAGYTEADIAGHLAGVFHFDVDGARAAGYTDTEIAERLAAPRELEPIPFSDVPPYREMANGESRSIPHATPVAPAPEASLVDTIFGRDDVNGGNVAGILPSLGQSLAPPTKEQWERLPANTKGQLGADLAAQAAGAGAMVNEGAARAVEHPRHPGQGPAGHQYRNRDPAAQAAAFRGTAKEQLAIAKEASDASNEFQPGDAGILERTLQGAGVSVGESLGALAVGAGTGGAGYVVGPALMGVGQGAQRYAQLRNAGMDEATAARSAALWTGIESLTEGLPFERLLSDIPGFKARLLKVLAAELPGENATTLGEMVDDWGLGLRGDETVGQLLKAFPAALADTTLQTLTAGGAQTAGAHAVNHLAGRADAADDHEGVNAPPVEQMLGALAEGVQPPPPPAALPAPPAPARAPGPAQLAPPALEVTPAGAAGTRAQHEADAARTLQVTPEGEAAPADVHDQQAAAVVARAEELGLGDDIVANLERLEQRKADALRAREARQTPALPPPDATRYVDPSGQAGTATELDARRRAANEELERAAQEQRELGYTPDVAAAGLQREQGQLEQQAALGDMAAAAGTNRGVPAETAVSRPPVGETAAPIALGDAIAGVAATQGRPESRSTRPEPQTPPAVRSEPSGARGLPEPAKEEAPKLKQTSKADERVDDVLAYVAKRGGISSEEAIAQGIDPATVKSSKGYGIRRPFRKGGMSFDAAAEMLHEAGYPVTDEQGRYSANKVLDVLDRATRGEKIHSVRNETEATRIESERRQAEERQIESKAITDRRQDIPQRKRVAAMSTEELHRELLTSHLTGLPNKRAYEEAERLPHQASIDVDSLKWVNDNMGHGSGDELLKAVGQALGDVSQRAYHISGDEFVLEGASQEELETLLQDVDERLSKAEIEVTRADGSKVTFNGLGVSYGTGKTLDEADQRLSAEKTRREAEGTRAARGARPPGVTVSGEDRQAGQDHGSEAPADQNEGVVRESIGEDQPGPDDTVENVTLKNEGHISHTTRTKGITLPSTTEEGGEKPLGDTVEEEQGELFTKDDARPKSTDTQLELANKLLEELDRYAGQDGDVKTVAVALNTEYRRDHAASLIGKNVKTPHDLATLSQVFRDPRYETLRYFATDVNGKVVGETGVSSRLPAAGAAFPAGNDIGWLRAFLKRTGAQGLRMVHNHPSGRSNPSEADIRLTMVLAGELKMPITHVVIDSNEYSLITADKDGAHDVKPNIPLTHQGADKVLTPNKPHPILGRRLNDPRELANIAKELVGSKEFATVIGVAGIRGEVRSLGETPRHLLHDRARARAQLQRFALQNGSAALFLGNLPNGWVQAGHPVAETLRWLMEKGVIRDAVTLDGTSAHMLMSPGWSGENLDLPVRAMAREITPKTPYGDLLGDDTRGKQALADKQRAKDEKRSPNKAIDADTGAPGDLFTKRRQMDIDEIREAATLTSAETAKMLEEGTDDLAQKEIDNQIRKAARAVYELENNKAAREDGADFDHLHDELVAQLEELQERREEMFGSPLEDELGGVEEPTTDEFIREHKTGNIPADAYDRHNKDLSWIGTKEKFTDVVKSVELGGRTIELRKSAELNQYVKHDEDGEIVRDAKGKAVMLAPEEIAAKGWPKTDQTIVAFDGDKAVGFASNEFGAVGVFVQEDYQRQGIGKQLLAQFRKENPKMKLGQMTPQGEALVRKAHKEGLIEEGGAEYKAGDRRETQRRDTQRQTPGRRSTDIPPVAKKGYARAAQRVVDAWNDRVGWVWSPLGKLPGKRSYLEERYKALGRVGQSQEIGRQIYTALSKASDADKQAVYEYMTNAAGDSSTIEDKDVRTAAVGAKNLIDKIGQRLVETGLLSKDAYEAHAGEYLPRVYLKHMLGESAFTALGNGKKLSDLGYLKKRQDIPEEIRKVILGEITDPAFLASFGATRTLRDLALVDFLTKIAGREQWTPPGATVDWNGRPVSPFWLSEEARQLRRRAKFYKPEEATAARKVADAMDSAVDDALEKLGKPSPRDFTQIPNSARYGALRGLWVRKEIYNDLVGAQGFIPRDASVAEMLFGQGGVLSRATQWWKMSKVVLNPPTQIRNFLSNLALLHLSGVPFHRVYSGEIIGRAVNSIAKKDRYYQIAKKYGLFATTFANQEGARIRDEWIAAQDLKGSNMAKMRAFAARVSNGASDVYAMSEAIGKIAKLIDGMEREGLSESDAMLNAHEALFDYSLVPRSVQYLRNQPLGAPFITYMYKALGSLAETAVKHPVRFAPYAAIPFLLAELLKHAYDVDDDDLKRLRKAFPTWMNERGHMLLVPYKDSQGRWQVVDMGYLAPWGQFADLAAATKEGKGAKELANLAVLSGPLADVTAALETNVDPFNGKEIVKSTDPPAMKLQQLMGYIWNLAMPGIFTESGGINQLRKALRGDTNLRGEPGQTPTQAGLRLLGLNVYPVDPESTRAANIRGMRHELDEKRQRLRELLKNPNLTPAQRDDIAKTWEKILARDADAIEEYAKESEITDKLKVDHSNDVPPITVPRR